MSVSTFTQPSHIAAPGVRLEPTTIGSTRILLWLGFVLANVLLALVIDRYEIVGTIHAYGTAIACLALAAVTKHPERVAYAAAYVVGMEVVWRMTDSDFFWEGGKYLVAGMFLIAMIRRRFKPPVAPLVYFSLLLPSILVTVVVADIWSARGMLSSTLSGPFALFVCAWFFSKLDLTGEQLQRLFLSLMAPVLGLAAIIIASMVASTSLTFGTESSLATSGGFGPNQVSSVLGLGALFGILLLVETKPRWSHIAPVVAASVLLAALSALTFSRAGLYNVAAALLLAAPFLLKNVTTRRRLILVAVVLVLLGGAIVLPRLVAFTEGALLTRFSDLDTTRRLDLVAVDFQIWLDNPILGVGPGRSKEIHADYMDRGYSTHTEFSRLPAEHGIFGILAVGLIFFIGASNLKRARTLREKALVAAMMGWAGLYMMSAAMRLVGPSFAIGLAFVTLLPEGKAALVGVRRRMTGLHRRNSNHSGTVSQAAPRVRRGDLKSARRRMRRQKEEDAT